MSTFTNDVGTVTIDFSYEFDLVTTPVLKIQDTSTYTAAQTGIKIWVKVTRPDGIIRNYPTDADITGNSGSLDSYDFTLPLDPLSGNPAQGNYKVEYKFTVGDDTPVVKTKTHNFEYAKINVSIVDNIDEFTPVVKVKDTTSSYDITNYTRTSLSREFSSSISAVSNTINDKTSTGTTTADREYNLVDTNSEYYDAEYNVTMSITTVHTHSTYSWVTVKEKITKTLKVNVYKPPTKAELIDEIDDLKNQLESYDGVNINLYNKKRAAYEEVVTGLHHLTLRLDAGDNDNENNEILQNIINILRNDVARVHTNQVLGSTSLTIYGTVNVDWTNILNIPVYDPFDTYIKTFTVADSTWVVEHNLGKKPSVTVVDDNDNVIMAEIIYDSNNQITINFNADTQGKVYLN